MAQPPILSWEGLGLQQGGRWLLGGPDREDINLHIGPRDRLALIGRNGAGKTTLFRLIDNQIEADRGTRKVKPGVRIVVLEQDPDFTGCDTLMDWALSGEHAPAEHEVEAIAGQLGIDMTTASAGASGGERRRAAIARALAQEPDLLLMDEPTNHLDLAAIDWLEDWLTRYKGAFIVISHDRTFLKRLTSATFWLDRGIIRRKEVGFGGYEAWEEQVYAEEARAAEKLDAKLKIEAHWLERGVTARRKRNQGRLEKLWQMRAQRAAMILGGGTAKLKLATEEDFKSKSVIVAENISKSYDDRTVIRPFSLRIQRGDRIGIVGANGAGKTTLLKMLTGELEPDSGTVTISKKLTGVMIDQQRSLMEPDRTVRQVLAEGGDWLDVRGNRKHVQAYLKDFLFDPKIVETKVGILSGGERSRLLLAREFARKSNLLVLDEPTNDLDLETLDLLQEVIADYDGTVLIVSHDRDFLDRTVTLTLGLDGSGTVDVVAGGYEDWERKRREPKVRKTKSAPAEKKKSSPPPPPPKPDKLSYKDQRDYELLPARIEELEAAISKGEQILSDPELYTKDPKKFAAISQGLENARAEKDAAEERWLELAEKVEG
ncbi:ATP-binding cassette domain-containing protein [Altererythrobacter sp.]|uniref:ABC-F family ATP-binding cassette domain-containing protein n=1 Tax=Altererythrobacter sp. TaxID=1872480 RepID=UPI001B1A89EF|nr:ATP-binding cassette domain-containing protein [Altererythrobacter sp.]MBO6610336.1 ATP-binding cassette domain-containing protein [Altererythrobacter sp.]MBO6641100.1 ATP-binding cassette domain-containing protein [Altererythrobacter sp.]MBO6708202.1 ATP-binding cassette domain-containing protein [Altererythrobacter sp.]